MKGDFITYNPKDYREWELAWLRLLCCGSDVYNSDGVEVWNTCVRGEVNGMPPPPTVEVGVDYWAMMQPRIAKLRSAPHDMMRETMATTQWMRRVLAAFVQAEVIEAATPPQQQDGFRMQPRLCENVPVGLRSLGQAVCTFCGSVPGRWLRSASTLEYEPFRHALVN